MEKQQYFIRIISRNCYLVTLLLTAMDKDVSRDYGIGHCRIKFLNIKIKQDFFTTRQKERV